MLKKIDGIPGKVAFRVTAIYYPFEGEDTVSDLFFGNTEDEAVKSIKEYLKHLKETGVKYHKPSYEKTDTWYFSKYPPEVSYPKSINFVEKNKPLAEKVIVENKPHIEETIIENKVEKEHKLNGTVWMINFELKDKKRIPADKVNEFIAKGYEKGGPRTKV